MINTTIRDIYRGDTIEIPIMADLKDGAAYRSQLRNTPDSVNYFTLLIEDNKMKITTTQSENLLEGVWYAELEENNNGVITTVERTKLVIKSDVTRTYGEPAPE